MLIAQVTLIGWLHTIACLIALPAGAYVLAGRKGTQRHRTVGWWYIAAMVVLNVSVFFVYKFDIIPGRTSRFGPGIFGMFHWFAVAALASVALATFSATRQRGSTLWSHVHAQSILGSYYGLTGGLINEMFARIVALRTLALQLSPHARNVTQTLLVQGAQTVSMLLWLGLALYFFLQVQKKFRKLNADAFTIGYPQRYNGGLFSACIGLGGIAGAFTGMLGWGFIIGAATGLFLSTRARRLVAPVWGTPSPQQQRVRLLVIGAEFAIFMALGSTGFFQRQPELVTTEVTILIVGLGFLGMRWSHGPIMAWLGLSVLAWLGAGMALHLPLQLLAIGDGLIKLGFGFAMSEALLTLSPQRPTRALMSEGVAPASRNEASVTA
jgi:uncharacterized membrane protein